MEANIMWMKMVTARRYWSWTAKLLIKAKNREKKKPNFKEENTIYSIIAPATQGNRDASHLQHMEGVMHLGCTVIDSAMGQGVKLILVFA